MENLVGRKIKGFEFEGNFTEYMKKYIGKIGVISSLNKMKKVVVKFEDGYCWNYPLDQIQSHLIPLEVFKLGQKVWDMSIKEEAGFVVQVIDFKFDYPIKVEFGEEVLSYTLDGKFNKDYPKTLSTTPYTFIGFSQETIIERGALVYVRNTESKEWNMRFYSHFENDIHLCFENQKREGNCNYYIYCQTENPLI